MRSSDGKPTSSIITFFNDDLFTHPSTPVPSKSLSLLQHVFSNEALEVVDL